MNRMRSISLSAVVGFDAPGGCRSQTRRGWRKGDTTSGIASQGAVLLDQIAGKAADDLTLCYLIDRVAQRALPYWESF